MLLCKWVDKHTRFQRTENSRWLRVCPVTILGCSVCHCTEHSWQSNRGPGWCLSVKFWPMTLKTQLPFQSAELRVMVAGSSPIVKASSLHFLYPCLWVGSVGFRQVQDKLTEIKGISPLCFLESIHWIHSLTIQSTNRLSVSSCWLKML